MSKDRVSNQCVLLVDDEQHILSSGRLALQSAGIDNVLTESDSRRVLDLLATNDVSVVVLDLYMPHVSGQELLAAISDRYPHIPVILSTAEDDVQVVVDCMRQGAFEYMVKPVEASRLVSAVGKALERQELSSQISSLKKRLLTDELEHPEAFSEIVACSKSMRAAFQYVEVVAGTRQPVLITGETGVGKELIAGAVHALSRCQGEFVSLNVAGLDDNMFADALFGHRKGAFTGADQAREGLVAKAANGTLFLDEIGDLSEMSQIKLLRLLQEREYYPVGSDVVRQSSARIVLATNRDLLQLIDEGRFRNDLYYRLYAHRVHIPPLRERPEDIPALLDHFLQKAATALQKKKPTPPKELAVLLSLYAFPGNVRELEALVFDAVTRHSSGILAMDSFQKILDGRPQDTASVHEGPPAAEDPLTAFFGHFPTLAEVEDYLIERAMELARNNQGMAAKMLGMGRQTLNKRLQKKKQAGQPAPGPVA